MRREHTQDQDVTQRAGLSTRAASSTTGDEDDKHDSYTEVVVSMMGAGVIGDVLIPTLRGRGEDEAKAGIG